MVAETAKYPRWKNPSRLYGNITNFPQSQCALSESWKFVKQLGRLAKSWYEALIMLIHRLRNELMIFSLLLIYSNGMKWWVWSVCLDSVAVVIVWTALKMSQEVFFLHNLDFYYYLYLLPKSKIDYDSPTILFLQVFILSSELLLEANLCEVLKKMKSFERLWLNFIVIVIYYWSCYEAVYKNAHKRSSRTLRYCAPGF